MKKIFFSLLFTFILIITIFSLNKKAEANTNMENNKVVFNFNTKTAKLNSGYEIPLNGIGTYSLLNDECYNSVLFALQNGVRLIDTAYIYRNEEEVGKAVKDSKIDRKDIFIITKLYPNQYSDAENAINEALKKLDVEYIDMMLLHHPGQNDVEAYKAIEKAVKEGKIRSIGLSNWYIKELKEFLPKINIMPALVQNEIHPYYQDTDVIEYIQSLGIAVQGWYPLGGRGHQRELLNDKVLKDIAQKYNKSVAQIILRWNLQREVIVIPGSSNREHIIENTEIYDFELSDEDMKKIAELNRDEKHDWY
ncbi:aldo/keto reductase [Brachyspira murdochii]|uniref:aldo/keto reductase n=1 Tax=Brachyspira murdochii TaxID=84378 RepID=UPI0012F4E76A|nr:aldo/keto reductase [Brachyspira murdochii]